ncbi:hypothetical protein GCM10010411_37520 [Actinomadura fulvescens]|uniref:VOC domain-containing protein n=1 Tax=Actinomadura fulvescens TaxID=46160 RepID=A0ABN3PSI3_9ACTN
MFGWRQDTVYTDEPQAGAARGEIVDRDDELRHPRLVIRVDDLDQMIERITSAGGQITVGRTEIPEIGMVYASFVDTEGNALNIVGDL